MLNTTTNLSSKRVALTPRCRHHCHLGKSDETIHVVYIISYKPRVHHLQLLSYLDNFVALHQEGIYTSRDVRPLCRTEHCSIRAYLLTSWRNQTVVVGRIGWTVRLPKIWLRSGSAREDHPSKKASRVSWHHTKSSSIDDSEKTGDILLYGMNKLGMHSETSGPHPVRERTVALL